MTAGYMGKGKGGATGPVCETAQAAADLANQSGSFLYNRLANLTWKGGSAVAGFLAGLKLG